LKLAGAVTQGSGAINEDGYGYLGAADDVTAAWIFDGVTGINGRNYLAGGTDAAWLVGQAHKHLQILAALDISLREITSRLVDALIEDWQIVAPGLELPENYDPPAACLILAKRYAQTWQAVRLGDSCLVARLTGGEHQILAESPNNALDHWLNAEAAKRRAAGVLDSKALLAEFQPQLRQGRKLRNTAGSYSILEANPAAAQFAEFIELGMPDELLLCTDGYYRAVDYYRLHSDESLLQASLAAGGISSVLASVRSVEAADPACVAYPRFKPADDATAVALCAAK
jgi:Protein phosphatase 2C